MDRSLIAPYRVEEKELSSLLYSKVMGLTLIYPASEEMTRVVSDEMFLKPNQAAFFQIMAYLFRLLDPIEFRKRFYWPITDKRAESNFRSRTVEYLKHLNEKHQLNWSGIKSYLVVMPGGMKFINFMLDFINFVTKELIKQKEKHLTHMDAGSLRDQLTATSIQKLIDRDNFLKKYASAYLNTINEVIAKTKNKIDILTKQLNATAEKINLSMDIFTSDVFIKKFHDDTYSLYKKQVNDKCKQLVLVEKGTIELKNIMEHFNSQADTYKCDNVRVLQFLNCFDIRPPQLDGKSERALKINTLIYIYNRLHDFIQNELSTSSKLPLVDKDFIINLLHIKEDLQQMENEINNLQMTVKTNTKKCATIPPSTPLRGDIASATNLNLENSLLMKFIATPPIKLGLTEDNCKKRLSLMDIKPQRNNEVSCSFVAPTQTLRSIREITESERDKSINNISNYTIRTTVINPSELLKTIGKQSSKYKTLKESTSGINFKLKPHDSSLTPHRKLCSQKRLALPCDIKITTEFVDNSQSPFTPLHSNDCTRIPPPCLNTSGSCDNSSTLNSIKKLSAVKKIQNATKDPINLNTSPSGRLTALFADDTNKVTPSLTQIPSTEVETETDENNSSAANVAKESTKWMILEQNLRNEQNEVEMLLNISDSVLNDVII